MRLFGRAKDEGLSFAPADEPPWLIALFAIVLGAFAALALAGIDLGPARVPFLVPMGTALAAAFVVGKLRGEHSVEIYGDGRDRRMLVWSGREYREMRLSELASVEREPGGVGAPPVLTLIDVHGMSLTLPLARWQGEERLLDAIGAAAAESGASGSVGAPVPVRKPSWITPAKVVLTVAAFAALVVLVNTYADDPRSGSPRAVTPERVAETRGLSTSPFFASPGCDVYVVPLDRPSAARVAEISQTVWGLSLPACTTTSYAFAPAALDEGRGQLDTSLLLGGLRNGFRAVWGNRRSTILGITEHDLFNSGDRRLRFVFGTAYHDRIPQAFAVISTARMGSGADGRRHLASMVVRYLGFYHYGLPASSERSSPLYRSINGLGDLDRMRPQLGDPPPSTAELMAARERYVAQGR